jgi:hypothetical protein
MGVKREKVHLVRNPGNVPEPVSSISRDEEVRLLGLADTALHNEQETDPKLQAGDNARQQHHQLKQEVEETLERFQNDKNAAA